MSGAYSLIEETGMFDFFSLYQAAIATKMLLNKQAQNLNIYFLSIGLCWAVVLLCSARIR